MSVLSTPARGVKRTRKKLDREPTNHPKAQPLDFSHTNNQKLSHLSWLELVSLELATKRHQPKTHSSFMDEELNPERPSSLY